MTYWFVTEYNILLTGGEYTNAPIKIRALSTLYTITTDRYDNVAYKTNIFSYLNKRMFDISVVSMRCEINLWKSIKSRKVKKQEKNNSRTRVNRALSPCRLKTLLRILFPFYTVLSPHENITVCVFVYMVSKIFTKGFSARRFHRSQKHV